MEQIAKRLADEPISGPDPWKRLWRWGEETLSLEGQEKLVSLMLEPHGFLIDDLAERMDAEENIAFPIDGSMTVGQLRTILERNYDWAIETDYGEPENIARFWYVSREKWEPRLGERFSENGSEKELPIGISRLGAELARDLRREPDSENVADFLLQHPEHRYMTRRAQITEHFPYAEIRDNLIASDMLPIDLLRCKLAFFGARFFDPRSHLWVRICLFHKAPHPFELSALSDWEREEL